MSTFSGQAATVSSRGTTIATGAPVACDARRATSRRPSPPSTASTIARWTSRRRSMSGPAVRSAFPLIAFTTESLLLQRRGRVGVRLERLLPRLARADAIAGLDGKDEHLPVADGARAAVLEDRVHDRLHVAVGHHALDLPWGAGSSSAPPRGSAR